MVESDAVAAHLDPLKGVNGVCAWQVLLTEPPMNPKKNRELMVSHMLDKVRRSERAGFPV